MHQKVIHAAADKFYNTYIIGQISDQEIAIHKAESYIHIETFQLQQLFEAFHFNIADHTWQ